MEIYLLQFAAFLRPIFYIDINSEQFFDVAAIVVFALLSFAFLVRAALEKDIRITAIDVCIVLFSIWCLTAYVTYPDKANIRETAKLIIPLWTYIVAKNILRSRRDYLKVLRTLILGFIPPVVLSVILIETGQGVEVVDYWTSIPRWRGAYAGSHSLGHNMAFLIISLLIFWAMSRRAKAAEGGMPGAVFSRGALLGYGTLAAAALYGLYQSQVRTAVLGLLVFVLMFLFRFNRKALLWLTAFSVIGVALALPVLAPRFFNDVLMVQEGKWAPEEIGSGRPRIWSNNLERYAEMPLDRKLAGVGIGNKEGIGGSEGVTDSHNDLLDVFMQTGAVGFVLFLLIQVLFLARILAMEREERAIFLPLFVAVMIMNFASNSYVTRFGLAQMYYIVLSYIETRRQSLRATAVTPVAGLTGRGGH